MKINLQIRKHWTGDADRYQFCADAVLDGRRVRCVGAGYKRGRRFAELRQEALVDVEREFEALALTVRQHKR